jgi:CelD/BcsL family acetyltransferase involved in cellulose biosynthesis
VLRYVPRYGDRYVVDLHGSFKEYLKKFSKKSRGNLQRMVRKLAETNGGVADVREFRTPEEMAIFRDAAVAISRASYKSELGWGFQEEESFARETELEAAQGRVRGYVLMSGDQPAAYVFCRIDHDVIVYKHIGYDQRFTQYSPGTALLYLVLERLFNEGEFIMLDFDGTEYYPYKEFFSTRTIKCARVIWFKPTIRNIALTGAHFVVTTAWRFAATLRNLHRRGGRPGWVGVRRLAQRPSRRQLRAD